MRHQRIGKADLLIGEQEQHAVGGFVPSRRKIRLELREIASEPKSVQSGESSPTWRYDPEQRRLIVDLHETASSQLIDLSME